MGVARYLIGIACGAIAFVPLGAGVRALRRRHLPFLDRDAALLVDATLFFSCLLVVSELLGSIGLFRIAPLVVAFAATGLILRRLGRGDPAPTAAAAAPAAAPTMPAPRALHAEHVVAFVAVAVVAGQYAIRTVDSLRRGMLATADTLWYHMPDAARFVQSGWTTHVHYVDGTSLTPFYPSASELPHALGIAFLRSDVLSPFINLVWLALALFAAWCVGKPFGIAPLTLLGAAIVAAGPEIWLDNAGSAYNDLAGIALLLIVMALLVRLDATRDEDGSWRAPLVLCAGLAAGGALGTKYTLLPPIAALTIALAVLARRGQRTRVTVAWLGGVTVAGAYWYVRNLLIVGNPLPPVALGIGPFHLPYLPYDYSQKISDYLFDANSWRDYFLPGLRHAFGPAWWAVLAIALAGFFLGATLARDRMVRILALVGALSFVGYIVSPQSLGIGSNLFGFEVNVRYFASALVLGAAALPFAAVRFGARGRLVLLVVYAGTFAATQFDQTIWPNARPALINEPAAGRFPRVVGVAVIVVFLVVGALWWASRVRVRSLPPAAIATVLTALLVMGYFGTRAFQERRYADTPLLPKITTWARDARHQRIALVGTVVQYPLFGRDFSNYVQYIAKRGPKYRSTQITNCATWRRTLNAGRYGWVIVASPNFPFPYPAKERIAEEEWTRTDPAVTLVSKQQRRGGRIMLFKIHQPLNPGACPT